MVAGVHAWLWVLLGLDAVGVVLLVIFGTWLSRFRRDTPEAAAARAMSDYLNTAPGVIVEVAVPPDMPEDEPLRSVLTVRAARMVLIGNRNMIDMEDVVAIIEAMHEFDAPIGEARSMFRGLYGAALGRHVEERRA